MNAEVTKENGNTVVKWNCRLDAVAAGEFEEIMEREAPQVENALVLDFRNVDYISSTGLRVLVRTYKNLRGKKFVLRNANSSVKEVLQLTNLISLFTVQ